MSELRDTIIALIDERLAELKPCECHRPKHEARPPHPDTQIGRRNG